jgi:NAD(P)-dependent dehydrogenase (short-subunit alcohol dehydrogenase family)
MNEMPRQHERHPVPSPDRNVRNGGPFMTLGGGWGAQANAVGLGDRDPLVPAESSPRNHPTVVETQAQAAEHRHGSADARHDPHGRLDVLVNNAGIETRTSLLEDP